MWKMNLKTQTTGRQVETSPTTRHGQDIKTMPQDARLGDDTQLSRKRATTDLCQQKQFTEIGEEFL